MELEIQGSEYQSFLLDIKEKIKIAQNQAMVKVNQELLLLYWNMGNKILELQKQTSWGDKFLQQLAKDLQTEFPNSNGFSKRNLFHMKRFALENPDFELVQTPSALISWSHNILC